MNDEPADFGPILTALADPTRRAVLDCLRDGPQPVVAVAKRLPVSRPAVSQHLKVLLDAGLVSVMSKGTRNIYTLQTAGTAPLVNWLNDLSSRQVETCDFNGLQRDVTVRLTPEEAWQLFCEDLAIWWPVAVVSLSAKRAGALPQAVVLKPEIGASVREILHDGSEDSWGEVTDVDPARLLALNWRFDGTSSCLSVRFAPEGSGTRLTLKHDHDTPETQAMWDLVITERFAAAAASSLSNF
ncbi:MAG: metalloregulator ArsR/SmtB family transcription factor [Pseudomonadota bacterium]